MGGIIAFPVIICTPAMKETLSFVMVRHENVPILISNIMTKDDNFQKECGTCELRLHS